MDPLARKLIGCTDAQVWAKEWVKLMATLSPNQRLQFVMDEGTMIGWFANAIMAGWDKSAQEKRYYYWTHWHNWRYESSKWLERFYLKLASVMPGQLRMWVVVDSTNRAREMYPHASGYAGPDGLGYREIYDGALRMKTGEDNAR